MRRKQRMYVVMVFWLGLLWGFSVHAQQKLTVVAENMPLNQLLQQVSSENKLRFAFNNDLFSQINATLSLKDIAVSDFFKELHTRYGINSRLIGGTYVFYISDEQRMNKAIEISMRETIAPDTLIPLPVRKERVISGTVRNAKTREHINFCTLKFNQQLDVMTNEMGYFSLTLPDTGTHRLQIEYLGYHRLDTLLSDESEMPLNIRLRPVERIEVLRRSEIRRFRFIADIPEIPDIVVFNPRSTIEVPAVESNDLINALTIIPGINYLKGPDYGLSIRGGASSDNLVLIDGIPLIETSHLMGNLSVLNAKYIQQAFVSRGGFGAEYGGRTSGIVDLIGKSGNNDVAVVDFTANLLHANIYVGLPITENSSLSGSFKKSFVDVWPAYLIRNFALEGKSIVSSDGITGVAAVDQTIVNYTDANLKLSIRPDINKEITLNYFSSYDDQFRNYLFPVAGNYTLENDSRSKTSGYSINYRSQKQLGWMNAFSIGYNHLDSRTLNLYSKDQLVKDQLLKPFYDEETIALSDFRASWKSEIKGRKLTQRFGAEYNANQLNFRYEDREIKITGANNFNDSIAATAQIQLGNIFYEMRLVPKKWLALRVGARAMYNPSYDYFALQPRYGIELMPFKQLKLHYSGGRYVQHMYLSYRMDAYQNISPIWFIPQNNQQFLNATHHIVGSRLILKNLMFNLEGYLKHNRDKIFFLGEPAVANGLSYVEYHQQRGEEMNRGIDVFLQYQTNWFRHLVSYSLSESFELIDGVNNSAYFPSIDHQLHRLRLTEIINFSGWTATVNWMFSSGMPYLLNSSAYQLPEFSTQPDFIQLDLGLVKEFQFENFHADVGITILNVFNKMNETQVKNFVLPEGTSTHQVNVTTTATSFSPLFYINLRYE
ncbi:MAG: TonB-dependent receptor plug domain-containing protein [Prolixibacteraceae bacterium]|nr:TonB-dependent receptor plug domain-containing protein [Prolixibacteraceae bacterium]